MFSVLLALLSLTPKLYADGFDDVYGDGDVEQQSNEEWELESLAIAIGQENAEAFLAVKSGEKKLSDLPTLQRKIVSAVLAEYEEEQKTKALENQKKAF